VSFAGDGFLPWLRAGVTQQLIADLRGHRVALCEAPDATPGATPLAGIDLALSSTSVLSLAVIDAVTDKRMTREVPLGSVPRDALALSITLAAEELLHASWIEAAFGEAPSPTTPLGLKPAPPAVQDVNAAEIARMPSVAGSAPRTEVEVAVLSAAERTTGGQTDLGGDLRVSAGDRLAVGGQLGLRAAPDVQSVHGVIHGRELRAGLALGYSLSARKAPRGAEIGVRADVLDVEFSGDASPGAQSGRGAALGAVVCATFGAWQRLGGPWRLVGEVDLGAPVHSVTASDEGTTATGVSGVSVGAALGLAVALPE
ncbi:MAG: hypothetical protein ACREJ3_15705, partial [Polyangiaceae bacterium]